MVGRTKVATKVVIRPCNVGASYTPGISGTEILPELKMVTQGNFWCKACKASTGYAEWRITIHRSSKMPGDRAQQAEVVESIRQFEGYAASCMRTSENTSST